MMKYFLSYRFAPTRFRFRGLRSKLQRSIHVISSAFIKNKLATRSGETVCGFPHGALPVKLRRRYSAAGGIRTRTSPGWM